MIYYSRLDFPMPFAFSGENFIIFTWRIGLKMGPNGEQTLKYIECPKIYRKAPKEKSIFLAGGITGCPDWQETIVDYLSVADVVLLNPRRKSIDLTNREFEEQQISWEFQHMKRATAILFWFCAETLCPITLFEYGKWIGANKRLFLGHHPNYSRRRDLHMQTALVRKRQKIHNNLANLAFEVKTWAC